MPVLEEVSMTRTPTLPPRVNREPREIDAAVLPLSEDFYVSMAWKLHAVNIEIEWSWFAALWRHDSDPADEWEFRCRFRDEDGKRARGAVYSGTEEECRALGDAMASSLAENAPGDGLRLSPLERAPIEANGDLAMERLCRRLTGMQRYRKDGDVLVPYQSPADA